MVHPDKSDIFSVLNEKTGRRWILNKEEPGNIEIFSGKYKLNIVWEGDYWTLNLYDLNSEYGEDKPKISQGPIHDKDEIIKILPGFLPDEMN